MHFPALLAEHPQPAITAVRAIATAAPGCVEFYCAGLSGTKLAAARARLIT